MCVGEKNHRHPLSTCECRSIQPIPQALFSSFSESAPYGLNGRPMRHPARCLKHPVTKPNSLDQLKREEEGERMTTIKLPPLVLGLLCVLCEDELPEPNYCISKQGCKSRVSSLMLERKKSQSQEKTSFSQIASSYIVRLSMSRQHLDC